MVASEIHVLDALPRIDLTPDPDDHPSVAATITGDAASFVSGDKRGLLDLDETPGIVIAT